MSAGTLVVGLGNPILGDDGVGWRVAEALAARLDAAEVEVRCLSLGGLALMEHLAGYRRALVIDAVVAGAEPGSVNLLSAAELNSTELNSTELNSTEIADRASHHTASVHDMSLSAALELGARLGIDLPGEIAVVGIEAAPDFEFGETLSPAVERAIPEATRIAEDWLRARNPA
jgi:hydrogenase maturation protease